VAHQQSVSDNINYRFAYSTSSNRPIDSPLLDTFRHLYSDYWSLEALSQRWLNEGEGGIGPEKDAAQAWNIHCIRAGEERKPLQMQRWNPRLLLLKA